MDVICWLTGVYIFQMTLCLIHGQLPPSPQLSSRPSTSPQHIGMPTHSKDSLLESWGDVRASCRIARASLGKYLHAHELSAAIHVMRLHRVGRDQKWLHIVPCVTIDPQAQGRPRL